jgi:hypothetical protein
MPTERGDPGRPIITITIGVYTFKNALCDFGSSVNIMPKVIYKKINGSSTPKPLRSLSPSMGERRDSISRTRS